MQGSASVFQNKNNQQSSLPGSNRGNAFFQPKLSVNQPNDVYEQEADAVADKVMRMHDNKVSNNHFFSPAITTIQRKCAHCAEEEKKAQRKEDNNNEVTAGPQVENYISSLSSGSPLTTGERSFFEPAMGYDLSQVQLHTDSAANASAKSINALAYTHGNHIVFGAGQYQPQTDSGKHLMAHELTHTVQQNNNSSFGVSRHIQRKLVVNPNDSVPLPAGISGPPTPLTHAVQGMLNDLCADGQFQVNTTSGEVTLTDASFCEEWHAPLLPDVKRVDNTATPAGCSCLCSVVNDAQTTRVDFRAGGPGTNPGSVAGAGAGQGGVKTNATVMIDPNFQGQYRINGAWVDVPFYLLFSHELCGHALPKMQGTHVARGAGPAGGTPPQEQHAVDVERDIAAEHSEPRRPDDYSGDARQKP